MMDDKGNRVKVAGPSTPVEILGLNDVPFSGEVLMAHGNEKEARATADAFIAYGREKMLEETKNKLSLDDLFDQIQAGNVKELNLVVKADVQGSVEAVKQSLMKLSNEEVMIKVVHGGVGAINESDVILASASNAIIIGFNVRPDAMAKAAAELRAYVADFTFSAPKMDIYSNLDGKVYDCSDLPAHLEQHMISPVRWTQLVKNGMAAGLTSACEIGPGKTLTGFAGKISKELTCKTVQDMAGVQAAAE